MNSPNDSRLGSSLLWAGGAGLLCLSAVMPSAVWCTQAVIVPPPGGLLGHLPMLLASDGVFLTGVFAFLFIGQAYGQQCCPGHAPYKGAWICRDGTQRAPAGFVPYYLMMALVLGAIVPALALLYAAIAPLAKGQAWAGLLEPPLAGAGASSAAGVAGEGFWLRLWGLLGGVESGSALPAVASYALPFLLLFVPQMLLEMKWMRRTVMAPTIPLLFYCYRLWQMARTYCLLYLLPYVLAASPALNPAINPAMTQAPAHVVHAPPPPGVGVGIGPETPIEGGKGPGLGWSQVAGPGVGLASHTAPPWVAWLLLEQLLFWTFDTAALLTWLPWTFNWHLQHPLRTHSVSPVPAGTSGSSPRTKDE